MFSVEVHFLNGLTLIYGIPSLYFCRQHVTKKGFHRFVFCYVLLFEICTLMENTIQHVIFQTFSRLLQMSRNAQYITSATRGSVTFDKQV